MAKEEKELTAKELAKMIKRGGRAWDELFGDKAGDALVFMSDFLRGPIQDGFAQDCGFEDAPDMAAWVKTQRAGGTTTTRNTTTRSTSRTTPQRKYFDPADRKKIINKVAKELGYTVPAAKMKIMLGWEDGVNETGVRNFMRIEMCLDGLEAACPTISFRIPKGRAIAVAMLDAIDAGYEAEVQKLVKKIDEKTDLNKLLASLKTLIKENPAPTTPTSGETDLGTLDLNEEAVQGLIDNGITTVDQLRTLANTKVGIGRIAKALDVTPDYARNLIEQGLLNPKTTEPGGVPAGEDPPTDPEPDPESELDTLLWLTGLRKVDGKKLLSKGIRTAQQLIDRWNSDKDEGATLAKETGVTANRISDAIDLAEDLMTQPEEAEEQPESDSSDTAE